MIEAFSNISTAFGLSASAGLNAYLPLLVVALTARYTSLITLNEPWNIMTNGWIIIILVILLLIEMTVDKIPAVDTLNDGLQTLGRPIAGAILFAASSGVVGDLHPALAFSAGLLLAGTVHTVKTVARPVVTASTAGTGNWVVSIIEDIIAFFGAVLAIIIPIIVAITFTIAIFLTLWFWQRRRVRMVGV